MEINYIFFDINIMDDNFIEIEEYINEKKHNFTYNDVLNAFLYGDIEIIDYILEMNINLIEELQNDDEYIFRLLIEKGYEEKTRYLLNICPDINISIKNEEPFIIACDNGYINICKLLLKYKPNIIESYYDNGKILITEHCFINGCKNGNIELLEWLLEIDKKINIDCYEKRGFQLACYGNNIKIVEWFMDKDIDISQEIFINTILNGNFEISNLFIIKYDKYINNKNIELLLFNVCNTGKINVLIYIIELIDNYNIKNIDFNIYYIILLEYNDRNHNYILKYMINKNEKNEIDINKILMKSSYNGNKDIVLFILDKYEDIIIKNGKIKYIDFIENNEIKTILFEFNQKINYNFFDMFYVC